MFVADDGVMMVHVTSNFPQVGNMGCFLPICKSGNNPSVYIYIYIKEYMAVKKYVCMKHNATTSSQALKFCAEIDAVHL